MECALACHHVVAYAHDTWCTHDARVRTSLVLSTFLKGMSLPLEPCIYLYTINHIVFAMWDYIFVKFMQVMWHTKKRRISQFNERH